jgi:hypothetical protein
LFSIHLLVLKNQMQKNTYLFSSSHSSGKISHLLPYRRKIILLLAAFVLSLPLLAQKFDGGVLAGFNGSQVRGDVISNGFHKLGLVGGVWVRSNINDNYYWNLELKYSEKGSRTIPTAKNNYYLYVYRLNYIDMPLSVGYQHKDYFSLFVGLSFNVLVNRSAKDSYGEIPLSKNLHNWETSFFTGIKVNFDHLVNQEWAKNFKLDFRYQFSAIPIYNSNNKLFYYSPYSQFNSVITSALYYTIDWQ